MRGKFAILAAIAALGASWPLLSKQPTPIAPVPPPAVTRSADAEGPVQPGSSRPLEAADLEAWLDGYIPASLERGKIAGAVVTVVKDGRPLLSKGYGYADVAAKKPMDGERTMMRIGSTSKLFTWTAVMQLVEQGKLDLNRDVNDYLDFKIPQRFGRPITLNNLMTHRGGFEEGLKEVLVTDPAKLVSNETYLKEHPRPLLYPAGDVPAYSNYGTSLAGYIVQRVSGESFDDYVERHILAPLRMQHTTFRQPLPEKFKADMSNGYRTKADAPYAFEMITTTAAGSVSASGADMANFMIAHLQQGRFGDAQILKPQTARFMQSPSLRHPAGFATMAHGFFSTTNNGRRIIGHGGDTIVFHTDMNLLPDEGVGIFVSFNSRGEGDSVYDLRNRLFEDFMDRYFPGPADVDPPALDTAKAHAQEIVGRYESSRRIETGFIGLFYVLQQDAVTANDDGTISLASSEDKKYREVKPYIWREVGGTKELQLTHVNGRKTIVDSDDPTSVLQAVPAARNARLNIYILAGSLAILLIALLAWPIVWLVRRRYDQPRLLSGKPLLAHRLSRLAVVADLAYLSGWFMALQPILETRLEVYGAAFDFWLRALQFGALLPILGAVAGLWNAWITIRSDRGWAAKTGSILLAAALLGVIWVAYIGSLMNFNLNY